MAVYLLHFSRKYCRAAHYLGSASDVLARLAQHRAGAGARLTAVVVAAGIDLHLARTWPGVRVVERTLKHQHHAPRLCPIFNLKVIRAVLLAPDLRGRWGPACACGYRTTWPSRAVAQIVLRSPQDWCDLCAAECAECAASNATP